MEDMVHHKNWKGNMWNRMRDTHHHDGKFEVEVNGMHEMIVDRKMCVNVEDTLRNHPLDKAYMNVKVYYEAIHKDHKMMNDMNWENVENAWKDVVQNYDMCHSNPCFLPICTRPRQLWHQNNPFSR